MELEYAFFAAQSQGTAEDDRPTQQQYRGVAPEDGKAFRGEGGCEKGKGHFDGVHQRVALFCVDFDDTLTDGDTLGLLVKTAELKVRVW